MTAPAADPLLGGLLGRYRILARLGAGGMGVVYRARDTALERDVALKVPPPDSIADPRARETLLREARLASGLDHPNVCTIHEVGEDGGRVFIAMELVEGVPLSEAIPPGGLPDETVVRRGAQIARALAHAHQRRVLHRDLKSANVMIGPDGRVRLLDFGLSRRLLDELPADAAASATSGELAGTPRYLAPEVLSGERATPASDLWSLGVVLHEMAAGRPPFGAGAVGPVVTAILHASPEPLPEHTGASLAAVILRCLAKDPAQRWRSADEVAAALEALLPGARPRAPRGRRRWAVAFAALGVVAGAALAWWLIRAPGGRGARSTVLVLPMEVHGQARDGDFAGRAFAEALAVDLAQARGLHVMPVPAAGEMWSAGTVGKARAALLAGAGRLVVGSLARDGDSLRVVVSLIDTEGNRVLWGEQRAAGAGDLSLLAAALADPLARELGAKRARRYDFFMYETGPPRLSRSPEMTEALGAVRRYELPHSLDATRRLVQRFPREPAAHVLRVAALLIDYVGRGPDPVRSRAIVEALESLHRLDPDDPWYDAARAMVMPADAEAIRLLSAVAERDDLTPAARGAVLAMRADKQAAVHDTAAAIADGERAVELDPASDLSLATLARALSGAGRYGEAAERVRQALALNPTVVNYWLQLGNCMLKQGQWQEYVADLERAAALSPDADEILSAQSDGLACLGRWRDAAQCARRALRHEPGRWRYELQLALASMRLGEWGEAEPLLERACAAGFPVNCPIHAAARAVALLDAGDVAAAESEARRATEMATTRGTVESKSSTYALACYHARRGESDAALRLLERLPAKGWVEPGLERDPNLAGLRDEPRFQKVAAWMKAQPIDRVFSEWGRSP